MANKLTTFIQRDYPYKFMMLAIIYYFAEDYPKEKMFQNEIDWIDFRTVQR